MRRSGLFRVLGLVGWTFLVGVLLVVETASIQGLQTRLLGLRLVAVGNEDSWAFLALGGKGIVALGVGVGVVAIGLFGAGLLFATGQVCVGLLAMGQAGIGLVSFAGQVGLGLTGAGQVVGGLETWWQGHDAGRPFLLRLNAELAALLAPGPRHAAARAGSAPPARRIDGEPADPAAPPGEP